MTKNKQTLARLPKWAREKILELEKRVQRAESTIPWTETGMEWYTLFGSGSTPRKLFTCSSEGARCVCALEKGDIVFIGRAKKSTS